MTRANKAKIEPITTEGPSAATEEELEVRDAHRIVDKGLLRMHYQPIVDLRKREIFAYEALCRPRSRRLKSPMDLVAAAVRAGRIGELGRLQRDHAVKDCTDFPLFLNIEPHEFDQGWLVRPDDPLFRHRRGVYLEITETVPLKFFDQCHSVLEELREKGILLAIDDLGAGFSNLKYITELEPDIVKLDRELVKGVRSGTRQFGLLESITQLCHDMGAKVVAEGVETEDELLAVIKASVDYCQGYLLARPALQPPEISFPQLEWAPAPQTGKSKHPREGPPQKEPAQENPAQAEIPSPAADLSETSARQRAAGIEERLRQEIRALESQLKVSERLRESTARRLDSITSLPAVHKEHRVPLETPDPAPIESAVETIPSVAPRPPHRQRRISRLAVSLLVTAVAILALVVFGGRSSSAPDTSPAAVAAVATSQLDASSKRAPEPAKLPGPPPQTDSAREAAQVASRVAAWAEAWSDQKPEDYLSFYSRNFQPSQRLSLDDWKQDRRRRLTKPSSIGVTVKELTVTRRSPDVARAEFVQHYESDSYRDQVRKTLILAREDGEWKIIREVAADPG